MSQSPSSSHNFLEDTGIHRLKPPAAPLRLKTVSLCALLAFSLCINLLLISDFSSLRSDPPPLPGENPFAKASFSLTPAAGAEHGREEPELALYMSHMQRYTQKLGLAIAAQNQPLATFYQHELEENLETVIDEVTTYDGMPIAQPAKVMTLPHVEELEARIKKGDWAGSKVAFKNLVKSCNMCHEQTKHGFIKITDNTDHNPFNQDFTP
ncbi:hypothetical protein [Acanthopleuribacter pedis]|uniref:Uncharacterized protein n=1 Tax=Acanthopleuribacter pedis TaxID=442870 RepID=A0A8J7QID7_9BACT|nr:hypothetical protein [Acanthopleuribacter pedis]MBO1320885.1 hypothetical protein [Acanthopleuribacter pedis]